MDAPITRRTFIGTASAVAAVALAPAIVRADTRPSPTGPAYARTGPGGIPAGTADAPSTATVRLLDGRTLDVTHATAWRIAPGRGVLVAPDDRGGWSVLYAEA